MISSSCSIPAGLWCSALTCWNVRHFSTCLTMSLFILDHQCRFFRSWYIFVTLGCTEYDVWWASSCSLSLILGTSGTEMHPFCYKVPSWLTVNSVFEWFFNSLRMFAKNSSFYWVSWISSNAVRRICKLDSLPHTISSSKSAISFANSFGSSCSIANVVVDFGWVRPQLCSPFQDGNWW